MSEDRITTSGTSTPQPGGKRAGAGRKPLCPDPMIHISVWISREHAERLLRLGDGNASAALRRVLDERFTGDAP